MKLRLICPENVLPGARICAEAACRGIEAQVIAHLREKNMTTRQNPFGMPKSNYYAEASNDVNAETNGNTAVVTVNHPGIALHYFGGTVRPKKKALAVPIDPIVAGIWPSEYSGLGHRLFKTPGGALGDAETGRILYILLPKADIPADETVLPSDGEIYRSAENAIMEALS